MAGEIAVAYRAGATVKELAEQFDIHRTTVHNLLYVRGALLADNEA